MQSLMTDVLVVGGGGAGAMAAYEASKHGVAVTMVLKGIPQHCGATIMAPGAIAGVGNWQVPGDSCDTHFRDTVQGGGYLNEQRLVRRLVEEAPDLILELERMGAMWQRDESGEKYALRIDGGHTYPRCPYLEDRTGREMIRALFGELDKRRVRIVPNMIVTKIITAEGKACGALAFNLENSELVVFRAKTVILACGGGGMLYQNTSNPSDVTGDGFALALEAGAELIDMEFVQFYPLGFVFPESLRGALGALLYHVKLRNAAGERFMERYDSARLELSTRDRVTRAIMAEAKEGRGGPRGGVFADMTYHDPGFIARMQPALNATYQKIGVDPEKDYLEIAPTCHFFMGGVKVNEDWESSIGRLFAVGETAAGVHGSNRLSQNALSEVLVSGARAGRAAAALATNTGQSRVAPQEANQAAKSMSEITDRSHGVRPANLRDKLRRVMWQHVGVLRSQDGITEALRCLEELKGDLESQVVGLKSRRYNQELVVALENYFLLTAAQSVTKAALLRTESRGAHYRSDYTAQDDDNWLRHIVVRKSDGNIVLDFAPADLGELRPERGVM